MLKDQFYPTKYREGTTKNPEEYYLEMTGTVPEMQTEGILPQNDIAAPYYMGYVWADDFPNSFRPINSHITSDGNVEFEYLDGRQNYSWGFMAQDYTRGNILAPKPQLLHYESGKGWFSPYDSDLYGTGGLWCFINSMQTSYITWSQGIRLSFYITRMNYVTHLSDGAWTDTDNVCLQDMSVKDYKDFMSGSKTITFNLNQAVTININDFNEDEYCFIVDGNDGFYYHIGLTSVTYIPKIIYESYASTPPSTGVFKYQVQPFFKVTARGYNILITFPVWSRNDNLAATLVIEDNTAASPEDYKALSFTQDNQYYNTVMDFLVEDDGEPWYWKHDKMIDVHALMDDFKTREVQSNSNYNSFIRQGRAYSRIGASGVRYTWRVVSCVHPKDIWFWLSFFNKTNGYEQINYNDDNSEYISTYIPATWTPKYNSDDTPTFNLLNGTLEAIESQLRPWQLLFLQDNTYDDKDKPAPPDPPDPPEPDPDDEVTDKKHGEGNSLPALDGIRLVSGDAFSTFYKLSMYHVQELGSLLSQMPEDFWAALGTATDYKESNILDYIVALKWYPINITVGESVSDIQFGFNAVSKVTLASAGTSFRLSNINLVYDMGAVHIPYRDSKESFLDYEPYTTVTAYLPYIGTVTLQSNDVMGYTISCAYIVDLTTGMATAILYNEYDTIYIGTGKIGTDITVAGNDVITQSERMAGSYISAATGAVNNALSIGTAAAAENATGLISTGVSSVADIATSAIGIANSKRGIPESVGSASGFGGAYTHQSPYITVRRPAVSIPGKYGHDIGYVCNRSYTIGALSGFTVCDNPDLSGIAATTAELDMVRQILTTGFYA